MAFEEEFNVGGPSRAVLRRAEERNDVAHADGPREEGQPQ